MSQTTAETTGALSPRQLANVIGDEYINGSFPSENSAHVRAAYDEIGRINLERFDDIPVPVEFTPDDPYDSFEDMKRSVDREGVFKVFSGGSHPEFLTREENIKGRAVHDWFGHIGNDVDFSFAGEFQKWDAQRKEYPDYCHGVLFAEVVGQVSVAYYLPDGFASDEFRQRQIDAPRRWIDAARRVVSQ